MDGTKGWQIDEGMKKAYGRRRDVMPLEEGVTPRWVVKESPHEVLAHSR